MGSCDEEDCRRIGAVGDDGPDLASSPFELGINLLSDCQARGVGSEAMRAFLLGFEEVVGPTGFVAKIEAANGNSRRMSRRLGFRLTGIEAFLTEDPQVLRSLEESRLSCIDEAICALAGSVRDDFAQMVMVRILELVFDDNLAPGSRLLRVDVDVERADG